MAVFDNGNKIFIEFKEYKTTIIYLYSYKNFNEVKNILEKHFVTNIIERKIIRKNYALKEDCIKIYQDIKSKREFYKSYILHNLEELKKLGFKGTNFEINYPQTLHYPLNLFNIIDNDIYIINFDNSFRNIILSDLQKLNYDMPLSLDEFNNNLISELI